MCSEIVRPIQMGAVQRTETLTSFINLNKYLFSVGELAPNLRLFEFKIRDLKIKCVPLFVIGNRAILAVFSPHLVELQKQAFFCRLSIVYYNMLFLLTFLHIARKNYDFTMLK